MTTEDKIDAIHDAIFDPDAGVFARLQRLSIEQRLLVKAFDKHENADGLKSLANEKRFDKIENAASGRKGWILGLLAALGIGGAAGSQIP